MQASNGSIIATIIICAVVLGLFTMLMMPSTPIVEKVNCPTAEEIAELIVVGDNQDVLDVLNEDEDWEDLVEDIATVEWEERDYKDIYKAIDDIYGDIDNRDDIDYVREAEDAEFTGMDVDDEDAIVTQYVKVKYEDNSGDTAKVYLTIETEIDEGEVEDQKITETI